MTGIPSPASVSAPPFIPRLSYVIIRSWRPDELMDIGWGWVGYREGRRYVTWDQRGSNGVRENLGDLGYSSSYGYYRLEFFIFFFEKLGIFLENFGPEISSIFSITKIVNDDPSLCIGTTAESAFFV